MQTFEPFDHYFQILVSSTSLMEDYETISTALATLKSEAVADGDEALAKNIWCFERIIKIHVAFRTAFDDMKERYFYAAWCALETVEKRLYALEVHYDFHSDIEDRYCLQFIAKHTKQFQSVYPYKMFSSAGMLIKKQVCSVCGKPISIRNPCGHKVGEIYNGERCVREVTDYDLLELSLVDNPEHKSSVLFIPDENGTSRDHYNYSHLDYVVRGLRNPFDAWDMEFLPVYRPLAEYGDIGRNKMCPCGSGKKYKNCCLRKPGIETKHLNVKFAVAPPKSLPGIERDVIVSGLFKAGTLTPP